MCYYLPTHEILSLVCNTYITVISHKQRKKGKKHNEREKLCSCCAHQLSSQCNIALACWALRQYYSCWFCRCWYYYYYYYYYQRIAQKLVWKMCCDAATFLSIHIWAAVSYFPQPFFAFNFAVCTKQTMLSDGSPGWGLIPMANDYSGTHGRCCQNLNKYTVIMVDMIFFPRKCTILQRWETLNRVFLRVSSLDGVASNWGCGKTTRE